MFRGFYYFPDLKVSPSEIDGMARLPGPTKDLILPTIRLRRWRGAHGFRAIMDQVERACGNRSIIMDLASTPAEATCEAQARLIELSQAENGYHHWVDFIGSDPRFVPVLQVGTVRENVLAQARALLGFGRGLVIRVRRDAAWNLDLLDWLEVIDFGGQPVLVVFDYGQIDRASDVTLIAATLAGLCRRWIEVLDSAEPTFTVVASSFPSNFADINRASARLQIVERQLHRVLSENLAGVAEVRYGDTASVFAGERGFSRGGAPRVDLPKPTRWVYHRKESGGYQAAAEAVMADPEWDENLIIWGTDRIRDARANRLDGLTYPQAWTAVRIHLHLHQQAHVGGDIGDIYNNDEEWVD